MKRIVICFDGTWNKPGDEVVGVAENDTNVLRFYDSVKDRGPDGIEQKKWYDQGVGTHWFDQVAGGVFGLGLETNIVQGYKQLVKTFDPADEIYIVGFSRGAYTARSLVGMLSHVGLVKRRSIDDLLILNAYKLYRSRDKDSESAKAQEFKAKYCQPVSVKFVGVWDTVGALGIPVSAAEGLNQKVYEFHDTRLCEIIEHAYHAVAIDEHRPEFDVCLWNPLTKPVQTLEQRWFAGAHADVGGGYKERELANISLRWMQAKAAALGLALSTDAPAAEEHRGTLHDSYGEFLGKLHGAYAKDHERHLRRIGETAFGNEVVDESVALRLRDVPGYQPQNPGL